MRIYVKSFILLESFYQPLSNTLQIKPQSMAQGGALLTVLATAKFKVQKQQNNLYYDLTKLPEHRPIEYIIELVGLSTVD